MSLFDGAVQALMALKTSVTADGEAEAATESDEIKAAMAVDGEVATTAAEEAPKEEPTTTSTTPAVAASPVTSPAKS